jgi:choline dehydrogenase-like flavoprotein
MLTSESTTFTLDNMGRYLCNTLQEAIDSTNETIAGKRRDFDVIVVGGGTFGSVVAERLFNHDPTRSRRILVLEAGPFVVPEHVQNLPFMGGAPSTRAPWTFHPALNYAGLLFAIGGRSLTWGGWSPELLDEEMTKWPASVRSALRPPAAEGYFADASRVIGVKETNDFIYGHLHTALRKILRDAIGSGVVKTGFTFAELLDHPAVRYPDPGEPPLTEEMLRDWLNLDPKDKTKMAELKELFKLEAPLAVQSSTIPGFFPGNKFSTVPMLVRAVRIASTDADGVGTIADARKRIMVVPNCHVQDLITETQSDGWVRVTGVRVWEKGASRAIMLAPASERGQPVVVLANGTIESTRIALTTFQQSLAGRAASRMGKNLMAHLRSNLFIRVKRDSIAKHLPAETISSLQCSALLVKGKAKNGHTFHFQITASGLGKLGADAEAEMFKKMPTIEHVQEMMRATDDTVVICVRGIGDMAAGNADSFVSLSTTKFEFDRAVADVTLGNAKAKPSEFPGSAQTNIDRATWDEMDVVGNEIALAFAGDLEFEILDGARVIPVAKGTHADRLKAFDQIKGRRDDLGTTHHDAGTLWMGDDVATSVTNEYGRIHDTTNCYVAGPALFPTVGSPNPMLTGVALGRRSADQLAASVLPKPKPFAFTASEQQDNQAGKQWLALFDGTAATFKSWRLYGPPGGGGMLHVDGEMVSYGDGPLRLFAFAAKEFLGDFTLRLQFKTFDARKHNSGVFLRFPRPSHDLTPALQQRTQNEKFYDAGNQAWKAVISGFEVQIDDVARGDSSKDFYGIPEPDGLWKNRTGAIYKIPAGDRVWHKDINEPAQQTYKPGPALVPGVWFELEIAVVGQQYDVFLTNTESGARMQTSSFKNTDVERGRGGFIGVQCYPGNTVAWRHIRIRA